MPNITTEFCRVNSPISITAAKAAASGFLLLGITGFISNLFVDFVIYRLRLYRILGHTFILSLSISDLIQSFFVLIFDATELLSGSSVSVSQEWCQLHAGIGSLAVLSTCMNLVSISVDRFIAIFFPLHYNQIVTTPKAYSCLAVMWFFMLVWTFLPVMGWNAGTTCLRPAHTICDFGNTLDYKYFIATSVMVLTAVIIVVLLQTAIYISAIKQARKLYGRKKSEGRPGNDLMRAQKKISRIVGFIVITFFITYIPWFSVSIRTVVTNIGGQLIIIGCSFMLYINSLLNPWVYASSDRTIRTEINKFFHFQGLSRGAVYPMASNSLGKDQKETEDKIQSV